MNYDKQITIEAFLEDIDFGYKEIEQMQADIDAIKCRRMREQALTEIEWIEDNEEMEAVWQDVAEHPADYIDNQAFKNELNLETFFYNDNGTIQDWEIEVYRIYSDAADGLYDKYQYWYNKDSDFEELLNDDFIDYLKEQLDIHL